VLAWALAQHSRFWTSAETYFLAGLFGRRAHGAADGPFQVEEIYRHAIREGKPSWLRKHGVDLAEFLAYAGLGINALFTSQSQGRRWIDQTPAYTMMTDVLVQLFPDAQFVHILRDGRRVVHSMIHFGAATARSGQAAPAVALPPWATDFRTACREWKRYVACARSFCTRHPERALTVVNENLVRDAPAEFAKILAFLHEAPEPGPASYFQTNRINSSFRAHSREPTWVQELAEPWHEWTLEQQQIFAAEAGDCLVECGFAARPEPSKGP
jgi:hypothetical protein